MCNKNNVFICNSRTQPSFFEGKFIYYNRRIDTDEYNSYIIINTYLLYIAIIIYYIVVGCYYKAVSLFIFQ